MTAPTFGPELERAIHNACGQCPRCRLRHDLVVAAASNDPRDGNVEWHPDDGAGWGATRCHHTALRRAIQAEIDRAVEDDAKARVAAIRARERQG